MTYDGSGSWTDTVACDEVEVTLEVGCTTVDGVVTPTATMVTIEGTYSGVASAGWVGSPLAATFVMSDGPDDVITLTVVEDAAALDECVEEEDYVFHEGPEFEYRLHCTKNVVACGSGETPPCYGNPTLKEYRVYQAPPDDSLTSWVFVRDLGVCCECSPPDCITPPCDDDADYPIACLNPPCDCDEPPGTLTPCWPMFVTQDVCCPGVAYPGTLYATFSGFLAPDTDVNGMRIKLTNPYYDVLGDLQSQWKGVLPAGGGRVADLDIFFRCSSAAPCVFGWRIDIGVGGGFYVGCVQSTRDCDSANVWTLADGLDQTVTISD